MNVYVLLNCVLKSARENSVAVCILLKKKIFLSLCGSVSVRVRADLCVLMRLSSTLGESACVLIWRDLQVATSKQPRNVFN